MTPFAAFHGCLCNCVRKMASDRFVYIIKRNYMLAVLVRKILFLPLENKIHIFAPLCNIFFVFLPFILPDSAWVRA